MTMQPKALALLCLAIIFPVIAQANLGSLYQYFSKNPDHMIRLIPCIWGEFDEALEEARKELGQNDICKQDEKALEKACTCQELSGFQAHLYSLSINVLASYYIAHNLASSPGDIILIYTDLTLLSIFLEYARWIAPDVENLVVKALALKLNELIPTPPI